MQKKLNVDVNYSLGGKDIGNFSNNVTTYCRVFCFMCGTGELRALKDLLSSAAENLAVNMDEMQISCFV
jgi:hypothetical protein